MNKLILFDIDGTLIDTGGAGTASLNKAFYKLFGVKGAFKDISMAGKTDIQIIKEGLKSHGFTYGDGNIGAMVNAYLEFLKDEIDNPGRKLKPGIMKILNLLRNMRVPLGLLTGNLEKGAKIKLSPLGLYEYFLEGAFGSDHEDRDMLLPIVIQKFLRIGLEFSPEGCVNFITGV